MINSLLLVALALGQAGKSDQVKITDDLVGKGPTVHSGDIVSVDYTGKLANGTQFDSSIGRAPFMFMVGAGQVIKGWDTGVEGMQEGGKRELDIPPELGYGDSPPPGSQIPPKSELKFTVILLKIEPKVQITVVTQGRGTVVSKIGDVAHVYFTGGVKGGKLLFDSTDNSKSPIGILIGQRNLPIGFIPALVGMKEGEKRKVQIPAALAYGAKGIPAEAKGTVKAGSLVPPNSDMEFTIELVKLEKP